jgi:hypothetical protein
LRALDSIRQLGKSLDDLWKKPEFCEKGSSSFIYVASRETANTGMRQKFLRFTQRWSEHRRIRIFTVVVGSQ